MFSRLSSRRPWVALALYLALPLVAAENAPAPEAFAIDSAHSTVAFKIRHLVTMVGGTFTEFSGTISVPDRGKPELASVRFTAKAASIDTANAQRDAHLKGSDFFDAEKYPEISFESTRIEAKGLESYLVYGKFSMHGVTREIVLPVDFAGFVKDPWGGERAGLSIQTTLNRKDYGISWNKALDSGGYILGEEVKVSIDLELVKAKPPSP